MKELYVEILVEEDPEINQVSCYAIDKLDCPQPLFNFFIDYLIKWKHNIDCLLVINHDNGSYTEHYWAPGRYKIMINLRSIPDPDSIDTEDIVEVVSITKLIPEEIKENEIQF